MYPWCVRAVPVCQSCHRPEAPAHFILLLPRPFKMDINNQYFLNVRSLFSGLSRRCPWHFANHILPIGLAYRENIGDQFNRKLMRPASFINEVQD